MAKIVQNNAVTKNASGKTTEANIPFRKLSKPLSFPDCFLEFLETEADEG